MFEVLDVVVVVVLGLILYFLSHLKGSITVIEERLNAKIDNLAKNDFEMPSLNGLKEEMLDIVESTIENLTPPTAFDHIAGAVSQYFQMRMMKELQMAPQLDMIGDVVDTAKNVAEMISND